MDATYKGIPWHDSAFQLVHIERIGPLIIIMDGWAKGLGLCERYLEAILISWVIGDLV